MSKKITSSRPLRVGFDFDGVVLFNPARTLRPFISLLKAKQVGVKRKHLEFFHPQTKFSQTMWWVAHQTSLLPADGLSLLRRMVDDHQVEAHVITGRNAYLKPDLLWKLRVFGLAPIFSSVQITADPKEQPHLFKEKIIKSLKLDVFVEDNWDIVTYLVSVFDQKDPGQPRILWITNRFDRRLEYPYRFNSLKPCLEYIATMKKNKT